ncbi:hypothetical protein RYX36_034106 [Vicia faba]
MLKRKFLLGDPIIIYELHTEMEEVIIWIRNRDKRNARDEREATVRKNDTEVDGVMKIEEDGNSVTEGEDGV